MKQESSLVAIHKCWYQMLNISHCMSHIVHILWDNFETWIMRYLWYQIILLKKYRMIDLVECLRKLQKNSNHRFSLFKGRYRSRANIYLLIYFPVYFICNCQAELWWQGWFMTCYFSLIRFLWYPLGITRTIDVWYTYIHTYINTYIHTYMFAVVNFDALAQASDIRIERRQVFFLCWMQDSNPRSQTPIRQQTECLLTNRLSYRGSSKTWTRQPVPMISKHSAHSTSLPVGFRTWLWRYTYLLLLISIQGQPMLAADPHSVRTATMATGCRWPVKQNNHYPTLSSAPSPGVTFDELNSLYWKLS